MSLTGVIWDKKDKEYLINYLELKAVYLAIKTYKSSWECCKHIRIRSDSTTAIAYINNTEDYQILVTI